MKLHDEMEKALNTQVTMELASAASYLQMAAFFSHPARIALTVVFFGRRQLSGVHTGTHLVVEGLVGDHHGRMAMLNPAYQIISTPGHGGAP